MITRFKHLFSLLTLLAIGYACNPDCDSASRAIINMEPAIVLPGSEFLLKSTPANFLEGRSVFIDDPAGTGEKVAIEARYEKALNGTIVTLPAQATAMEPIYVEDPDCRGDYIYVNDLRIEPEDFFFSSDLFVVPPIPIVIVPTPPPAPPVGVTNAWITPYRRSYCIWFVPEIDENGNEKKELRPYDNGKQGPAADPFTTLAGSHEFVVCGEDQRHAFANINPVSGIIDRENNFISIRIDRTAKGLGVERFTGSFIDVGNQIPNTDDWRKGGGCDGRNDNKEDFMLLTSSSTGQQLLMIKALPE